MSQYNVLEMIKMQKLNYENLSLAVKNFKKSYSNAKVFSLGRSVANRRIYCLGLGTLRRSRLYVGGTHGSEWLTTLALLRFANSLAENEALYDQLENCGVMIIPCLNPDGCEIATMGLEGAHPKENFIKRISKGDYAHYNANLNGVDINHNFNAGFEKLKELERQKGITAPAPKQYGGEYPESEPETHALCTLCNLFEPEMAFSLHSQGEEIFYTYENYTPNESEKMAKKLAKVSGYAINEQSHLASHGGFKDWFLKEKHRPAFTIEMGKGQNPLDINDFEKFYEKLKPLLDETLNL